MKSLGNLDLTKVIEITDNTNLSGEAACAGGACLVDIDISQLTKE